MILIQARSTSKRFPGKCLAEINGYPMIYWVLRSCLTIRDEHQVILAIPNRVTEIHLTNFVNREFPEILVVPGDEDNVYLRFKQALESHRKKFEHQSPGLGLIRVCADRPLLSPILLSELRHSNDLDFELIYNHETGEQNGPSGVGAESLSKALAMDFFFGNRTDWINHEHVTSQIYRREPNLCKLQSSFQSIKFRNKVNYSIDFPEDLQTITRLVKEFKISPGDSVAPEVFLEMERFVCEH